MRVLVFSVLLVSTAATLHAADERPIRCDAARPYVGGALYTGPVALPPSDLKLGSEIDDINAGQLLTALQALQSATKAPLMSVAVANAHLRWSATRSVDGAVSTQRLYCARVGKSFTAVVVLQLVEEGKPTTQQP
ncbi:MAG: hypothetical protein U0V87_15590 [Acidobacteriota bacterium]